MSDERKVNLFDFDGLPSHTTDGLLNLVDQQQSRLERVKHKRKKGDQSRLKSRQRPEAVKRGQEKERQLAARETARSSYTRNKDARKKQALKKYHEKKKELADDDEATQKSKDHRAHMERLRCKRKKQIKLHNTFYPSAADNLEIEQTKKEPKKSFGRLDRNSIYLALRVKNMGQDIDLDVEPHGNLGEGGHFQTITHGSMAEIMYVVFTNFDERIRKCNTLDLGTGLAGPPLQFSQYGFDRGGIHIGIELDRGLAMQAKTNIQQVTLKGIGNLQQGFLTPESIQLNGELNYVVPPCATVVTGNIVSVLTPVSRA